MLRKSTNFNFSNEQIKAFEKLKDKLTAHSVLRIYNFEAETELHTDASTHGLAAMLLQKQDEKVNGRLLHTLVRPRIAQRKITTALCELETLVIVRAIERFHVYLYGLEFSLITDCNALVYAINKANLNPRVARWVLLL